MTKFNLIVGRIISWLALALVLVTVWDVALRYLFSAGSVAVQELEWHVFSLLFLLSAAYTQASDGHVRVDIFYSKLSPWAKALINAVGAVVFLIPFCLLIIWASVPFVEAAWVHQEASADPGGLPYRYIIKSSIILGFALLLLQACSGLIGDLKLIFTKPEAVPND